MFFVLFGVQGIECNNFNLNKSHFIFETDFYIGYP